MKYTITNNQEHKGVEISFDCKPSEEIRNAMKAIGLRWHSVKKVWYGHTDAVTAQAAIEAGEEAAAPFRDGEKIPEEERKPEVKPDHDFRVGDLLYSSWGWDQTNIDFFQIVKLCGKKSVRVRAVSPRMIKEDAVSGMSRYCTFEIPETILPAVNSIFIKDNENGDLYRVSDNCIRIEGRYLARKYNGGKLYESWYA